MDSQRSAFVEAQREAGARLLPSLPGAGVSRVAAARSRSLAAFLATGLPGPREETWRHTPLRPLAQRALAPAAGGGPREALDPAAVALPGLDATRLVFVDGRFDAGSSRAAAAVGLRIERLADALERDDTRLRDWIDGGHDGGGEAFARLAAAFAADGAVIDVAEGAQPEAPVHLVVAGSGAGAGGAWHLRHAMSLGAGASLTVVEHQLGLGAHDALANVLLQVRLGAGARLRWLRIQSEGDTATLVQRSEFVLEDGAVLEHSAFELGGQLARHDLAVRLAGAGARVESHGVFALRGRQHGDVRLAIDHAVGDTACELAWRGIADQRARGVFRGAIRMRPGADGANARLENKNLLLSPHGEIDTQPVLEIEAEEVKAAHGATVGQLDERALFYLRSRGVPLAEARRLLTFAFCRVLLDRLPVPSLESALSALLAEHLPTLREEGVAP